jgi:hypothetical protein
LIVSGRRREPSPPAMTTAFMSSLPFGARAHDRRHRGAVVAHRRSHSTQ